MKTINIKLLRDLKNSYGQGFAIIMVIAAGVATFTMSLSTLDTLIVTRDTYYRDYRFADIFASVNRAPESIKLRIAEIDGVEKIETRVVAPIKLKIKDYYGPIIGQAVSIPDYGKSTVNQLYLLTGRNIDPERDDEVILNEVFAEAHNLLPGDSLEMIIKGHRQKITVVGIALSPEFIYQIAPGSIMPDFQRFGVLWMARSVLEKAYEMDNAFNNVVLVTKPASNKKTIIEKLDLYLEQYGGLDAQERYWQVSHRIFQSDIDQLKQMAIVFSTIFLGIAAFLLNIVISRLIDMQRELIAAMKAFGYSNFDIGLHYLTYVLVIVILGLLIGTVLGIWLGRGLSGVYIEFYRLPNLRYEFRPLIPAIACIITFFSAAVGTIFSVSRAVKLQPAEAMRPEPPAKYSKSILERIGMAEFISQSLRMIVRHIERKPFKTGFSIIGIALACAIMVVGTFFKDAIEFMVEIEFGLAQRQDITINFTEPTSYRALYDLQRLPGVSYAEAYRNVPVKLYNHQNTYLTNINAYSQYPDLYRILNLDHEPIEIPKKGILLTEYLAQYLQLSAGDNVFIQALDGKRPLEKLPVAGIVKQYLGVGSYMDKLALNRLMFEDNAISGAYLKIDPTYEDEIFNKLHNMPRVADITSRENTINSFYDTSAEFVYIFTSFISVLSIIITFGVIYNAARIALSERSRDLASMRVLGFTRTEISIIFLGELALLTIIAIPLGLVVGHILSWYMIQEIPKEIFQIPLIIEPSTYSLAASIVVIASIFSGLIVRSKLDNLDLISVLKTKE